MEQSTIKTMFEDFYEKALPKNTMLSKEAIEALYYATLAHNSYFMRKTMSESSDLAKGYATLMTIDRELNEHMEKAIKENEIKNSN
ncbi:MAG TPA: hypothetical protein VIV55_09950 [Flavobacterium sp.]